MRRPLRRPGVAALVLAGAGLIALAAPALAAKDDVVLISRATGPAGAPVDATAAISSASASGDQVAFDTDANNISAEDNNAFTERLRPRRRDQRDHLRQPRHGRRWDRRRRQLAGPVHLRQRARRGLRVERRQPVDRGQQRRSRNVFVRDLAAGTTTLVSRATGPGGAAGEHRLSQPGHLGRRALRRLPVGRRQPLDRRQQRLHRTSSCGTSSPTRRPWSAARRAPTALGRTPARPSRRSPATATASPSPSGPTTSPTRTTTPSNNVFVRDLSAATNAFVSRATGAAGAPGDGALEQRRHLALGPLRDLPVGVQQPVGGRQQRRRQHLPARPRRVTTTLMSRASGPGGAGADAGSFSPVVADNARVAFSLEREQPVGRRQRRLHQRLRARPPRQHHDARQPGGGRGRGRGEQQLLRLPRPRPTGATSPSSRLATNLVAGTIAGVGNIYRRDVLGDAPISTPVCKILPLPPAPPDKDDVTFTLTVEQLQINQRISQAAIRRLNAVAGAPERRPGRARPVRLLGRPAPARAGHHQRSGGGLAGPGGPGRPGADRRPRPQRPARSRSPSAPSSC